MNAASHLHETPARSTARLIDVLRYPRRPSMVAALALIAIVLVISSLSIIERRVFIDAYIRDTTAKLAYAADSPYLVAQLPDMPDRDHAVPASGITVEPQIAAFPKARAYWGLPAGIAWHLACQVATALFLALAMLCFLRRWAMPPAAAFLLSLLPPSLYLLMPGPMAFHLALMSVSAEVLVYAAALLWIDSVLDSRRQDLPVLAMIFEAIVLFLGAWIGPYFWIFAALIFARRLVTRRWRTVTNHVIGAAMYLVPAIMGAVASIALARSLPVTAREVPALFPGAPGFWGAGMTESYGVYGLAALVVSVAVVLPGLLVSFVQARRTSFAISGAWSAATLAAVILAAPVCGEAFIRLRSTPWDVDTLFYAPAVAVVPFALVPALIWTMLPYPNRRWSTTLAMLTVAVAAAVLAHEHPRHRGLLPQPRLSAALVKQSSDPNLSAADAPFKLVDFRIRPVDTAWCRAYATFVAVVPPAQDWTLRIRGTVPDQAVQLLPEHQRDSARAEWMIPLPGSAFPKAPRTLMVWSDLAMGDLSYDLTVDLVRTDATGSEIVLVEQPLLRVAPFNPFDQRDTCALRNAGFDVAPSSNDWMVAPANEALVKHEIEMTLRGAGALRCNPGAYYTIVRQDIQSLASVAGRTITFSAAARASEPLSARLMISLGVKKFYSPCHPGDDGWHTLTVSATAPLERDLTSISLHLVHGGKPKEAVVFDEAQLEID